MSSRPARLSAFALLLVSLVANPRAASAQSQCTTSATTPIPMSAMIAAGGYLSSDGRGSYVDGSQGSTVNLHNAASLVTNEGTTLNKNSRYVAFNFNSPNPVATEPVFAYALGSIQDRRGEVHVLYEITPGVGGAMPVIHPISDVPADGVPVTSQRTDLVVHINGVQHLLMFGGDTWPLNFCRPDLGTVFGAPGTTKLQITRQGDTYTLQAPPGSIGRLFDYSHPFAPVDKGLYQFSFVVTMSPPVPKGKGK